MINALVLAALLAGPNLIVLSDTDLGITAASLSATPLTNAINMGQKRTTNQLSLFMVVVKGTSAQLRVKCLGTSDEDGVTGYIGKYSCTSTATHVCTEEEFDFDAELVALKTTFLLDVPTNYPFVKCSFDDPGDGSGTITVTAVRGL